jgi:hypothetical protein
MMNVMSTRIVIEKHAARGTIIRIYMDDIAIATSRYKTKTISTPYATYYKWRNNTIYISNYQNAPFTPPALITWG